MVTCAHNITDNRRQHQKHTPFSFRQSKFSHIIGKAVTPNVQFLNSLTVAHRRLLYGRAQAVFDNPEC